MSHLLDEAGYRDRIRADARRNLRDHFAGLAMQAMTASPELMVIVTAKADGGEGLPFERLARQAYRMANAMLIERDREEPSK